MVKIGLGAWHERIQYRAIATAIPERHDLPELWNFLSDEVRSEKICTYLECTAKSKST